MLRPAVRLGQGPGQLRRLRRRQRPQRRHARLPRRAGHRAPPGPDAAGRADAWPRSRPAPSPARATSRWTSCASAWTSCRADKELLVFCQVGLRGYLACRLLASHGFRCRNLTGGYTTYRDVTGMNATCKPEEIEMSHDTGETAPATAAAVAAEPLNVEIAREIDAIGLQCPGPIMRLRTAVAEIPEGRAVPHQGQRPGLPAGRRRLVPQHRQPPGARSAATTAPAWPPS